ncbi:MAG: hypothetical protein ACLTT1_08390 [[Clostridium] scindens]
MLKDAFSQKALACARLAAGDRMRKVRAGSPEVRFNTWSTE